MSREGAQVLGWIVLAVAVLVGCMWYGLAVAEDRIETRPADWVRR